MSAATNECFAHRHHKLSGVRMNLSEDILRYLTKSPENQAAGDTLKTRLSAFLTPELVCLLLYRMAHYFYVNEWRWLAQWSSRLNFLLHKVSITPQSCIGPGCRLPHPANVTFHGRAGCGLTLYSLAICCPRDPPLAGPVENGPRLGDRVTVGGHSVVIGPVSVEDDTKIAFSVGLDRDAPSGTLVVSKALRLARRPLAGLGPRTRAPISVSPGPH